LSNSYFIHPRAIVESSNIGRGTKIWAFSHVAEKAVIGENCNIGEGCYIENNVVIGNNVVVKNNIAIWDGVTIEDDVFLGPNVVLTNDLYPRAKVFHADPIKTLIKKGASIGANSTIICGITIGEYAMIGAGSVVSKDVRAFSLVYGNPARFISWICACTEKLNINDQIECKCGRKYRKKDDYIIQVG
jgi:acetyltransferase-like isoleucine patch superfamily enzyme